MLLHHFPLPVGGFMLIEPGMVHCPDFLVLLDPECPRTHFGFKTDIYGLLSHCCMLSTCSALLVFTDVSSASESSEIGDIVLFTIHGVVLRHSDALLECYIAGILACCCGPDSEPESTPEAGINHYGSRNQHDRVDC